jgi:hypothetical protein
MLVAETPARKHPIIETSVPLEVYVGLVEEAARSKSDLEFANSCPYHARIIISKLFEIACTEVCVVSGSLTQRNEKKLELYLYPPLVENVNRFLQDPNAKLSIIVQSGVVDNGDNNEFLRQIIDAPSRHGIVELTIPAKGVLSADEVHHFIVVDSWAYRLESECAPRCSEDPIGAVANFGDEKQAKDLRRLFSEIADYVARSKPKAVRIPFARGDKFGLK